MLRKIVAAPPLRARIIRGTGSLRLLAARTVSTRGIPAVSLLIGEHCFAPLLHSSNINVRCFSTEKLELDDVPEDSESDDGDVVTLEDHFTKAQHKKKKNPRAAKISNSKKTRENAESVFDFIASHIQPSQIQMWSKRLKDRAKHKERLPQHTSIEERVHFVFHTDDSEKINKRKKKNKSKNKYTPPPIYVQKALAQFFAGNQITREIEVDDPRLVNRQNWESNVDVLVRARDLAVQNPLFWSNRGRKSLRRTYRVAQQNLEEETNVEHDEEEKTEEADDEESTESAATENTSYLQDRASRIAALHDWKPEQVRRDEAEALASILADRLPPEEHDSLMKLLTVFVEGKKSNRIRMLFVHLKEATKAHVIWIATDVAEFFYVDTPDNYSVNDAITAMEDEANSEEDVISEEEDVDDEIVEENDDDGKEESSKAEDTDSSEVPGFQTKKRLKSNDRSDETSVRKESSADPRLQEAHKKWNDMRFAFVDNLLDLYNSPYFQLWRITPDMIKDETEETTDLDNLIKNREEREKKNDKGKRRKKVHLVFDAIMLQPQWSSTDDQIETEIATPAYVPPATDRTVFIDNLPIDIKETEIIDNYSRCGPIESVRIFNQRPDLDPGRLSRKKTLKAIKDRKFKFQTRRQWKRARTPLYGAVTFANPEGFEKAMQDSLRVFGMVIRKHPVRSIRAAEMKKFYLEGIPPGFFSTDVEHTVSSLLHPHVYVCLGMNFRNYDEPTSCEFRFGTFEAAHHAFTKLENELNMGSDECTLNWMSTPKDAISYWTRKRGLVVP